MKKKVDKIVPFDYISTMQEVAPLEQLSQWLQRYTTLKEASLVLNHVSRFVTGDLEKMLGEDGKVAIAVVDRSLEGGPMVFIDPVFPWESRSGIDNARKVNDLIGSISNDVLIPLRTLRGNREDMGIHSWCLYQGDQTEEELLEGLRDAVHVPPLSIDYENPDKDPFDLTEDVARAKKVERFIGLVSPRMLRATGFTAGTHPLSEN